MARERDGPALPLPVNERRATFGWEMSRSAPSTSGAGGPPAMAVRAMIQNMVGERDELQVLREDTYIRAERFDWKSESKALPGMTAEAHTAFLEDWAKINDNMNGIYGFPTWEKDVFELSSAEGHPPTEAVAIGAYRDSIVTSTATSVVRLPGAGGGEATSGGDHHGMLANHFVILREIATGEESVERSRICAAHRLQRASELDLASCGPTPPAPSKLTCHLRDGKA